MSVIVIDSAFTFPSSLSSSNLLVAFDSDEDLDLGVGPPAGSMVLSLLFEEGALRDRLIEDECFVFLWVCCR